MCTNRYDENRLFAAMSELNSGQLHKSINPSTLSGKQRVGENESPSSHWSAHTVTRKVAWGYRYCLLVITVVLLISANLFAQADSSLFVPIILSSAGENGSFFTSEMTLTNKGDTNLTLDYRFTAAFGGGSGQASDSVLARQQRIIPDAIAYLKSLGVPIPDSGDRGGTLSVQVHNLASPQDFAITIRTTTTEPEGRAGMAYAAVRADEGLQSGAYLFGLRQNDSDRSNIALQNMGSPDQGSITLTVKIFGGDPSERQLNLPFFLPQIGLAPGEWRQISGILHSNGLSLSNGYIEVERAEGTAPFYAYAVVNNQANSDGSFIPPISLDSQPFFRTWTLPVIVENGSFSSELVVTNVSQATTRIRLSDGRTSFELTHVRAGEQVMIPNLVQYLRDQGITTMGSTSEPFAGALSASAEGCNDFANCLEQPPSGVFFGVRTSSPAARGRYGVYYNAVPWGTAATNDAWLYDFQQDGENRTNLALVNTGENNEGPDTFQIDLFDGISGQKVNTIDGITLGAHEWAQMGNILAKSNLHTTQGYAHVTRISGSDPFIAYAVINDGGQSGTGTGDGAFVASVMSPESFSLDISSSGCSEQQWNIEITNAPPNSPIHLVGDSAGVPSGFDLPQGAKTDSAGHFIATVNITSDPNIYSRNMVAYVGGLRSNVATPWSSCDLE